MWSVNQEIDRVAEVMAKSLLSQGMVEAVRALTRDCSAGSALEEVEQLHLDDVALWSDSAATGQNSSTPREEATQVNQAENAFSDLQLEHKIKE